jgi:CheY-like chemotaxis protein
MASILIIEDTVAVRVLFRAILEQAGHVVCEASTGSEGIRLFRAAPTDVVITDIYMPDGDGLEVITHLRQAYHAVKILAISGRAGQECMLSVATRLGADGMLAKPVSLDALLTAVTKLLGDGSTEPGSVEPDELVVFLGEFERLNA